MKAVHGLSIGAVSKSTDLNVETIRYYERIGLMPAPKRTPGGFRRYREDHVKRLSFIRHSRELGFSLADVCRFLRLVDQHDYTCAEIRALTLQHLGKTCSKIAELRRVAREISGMTAKCTGQRVPECAVIDALFETRAASGKSRDTDSGCSGMKAR